MEAFIIAIVIGLLPAFIAQSKGRNFFLWWLFGAALFIVALPAALIIKKDTLVLEKEAMETGSFKRCTQCAEITRQEAKKCKICGSEI